MVIFLGEHWEARDIGLAALRTHLAKGEAQAQKGDVVMQSLDSMLQEFKERRDLAVE